MLVLDISGDLQLPRHHVVNLAQYDTLEAWGPILQGICHAFFITGTKSKTIFGDV